MFTYKFFTANLASCVTNILLPGTGYWATGRHQAETRLKLERIPNNPQLAISAASPKLHRAKQDRNSPRVTKLYIHFCPTAKSSDKVRVVLPRQVWGGATWGSPIHGTYVPV